MIDIHGIEEIAEAIEHFAEGNPHYFEIDVAEGVWFMFDCTHQEDLNEPLIPVTVGIDEWSPYNEEVPEQDYLMDYSDKMDELTADLEVAFYNGGSRIEEVRFIHSEKNNSTAHLFHGAIHNPIMATPMTPVEVTEK